MAASKARLAANRRYDEKAYDRVNVLIRKDAKLNREFLRSHAEARGESLNGFILRAVAEVVDRDNATPE